MAEEFQPAPNYYNTELSQSESIVPLSPILGSGQSARKFRKNRQRSKRDPKKQVHIFGEVTNPDSCLSITEEDESDSVFNDIRFLEETESLPSPTTKQETIFEHIKNLEALELQRDTAAKTISLNTHTELEKLSVQSIHNVESTTVHTSNKTSFECLKEACAGPICFQTSSEKSQLDMHCSQKLFEDTTNVRVTREDKQNYLHKSENEVIADIFQAENFDYLSSKKCDALENKCIKKQPEAKKKNIFEGENFDDIYLKQSNEFKPTSNSKNTCLKEAPETKQKNIFEGENFDDLLNLGPSNGFKPASLINKLERNKNDDQKNPSKETRRNIFEKENFDDLNVNQFGGFKPASVNITICLKEAPETKHDLNSKKVNEFKLGSLFNASKIDKNYDQQLEKASKAKGRNVFEGERFDDLNLNQISEFRPASIDTNISKSNSFQCPKKQVSGNIFDNINLKQINGFKSASLSSALEMDNSLKRRNIFERENFDGLNMNFPQFKPMFSKRNLLPIKRPGGFPTPCKDDFHGFSYPEQQASLNISSNKRQISNILLDRFRLRLPLFRLDVIKSFSENIRNANDLTRAEVSIKKTKKRLGCPFSPTIELSQRSLKRARLLFEDLGPKSSTPRKISESLAKPLLSCDLTPIRGASWSSFSQNLTLTGPSNRLSLNKPSGGDVKIWLENLNSEKCLLEERLRVIEEKRTILTSQLRLTDRGIRTVLGVLYKSKNRPQKLGLREYVDANLPGSVPSDNAFLLQINPQNARLVHFCVCDKRASHIKTNDGALIVPNSDSRIGLSEIEHSFKQLEEVDQSLIPKGWITNHYRWIVWKLASYERMFPDKFGGCLVLENVVQQLKYRYDIEIDNVKRSILRKIFEKDDCPQRRMILCVSKIAKLQLDNSYELELTDGWYPIRTVLDPPLCDQIAKGKIRLGVKLVIYGAELMNCDGCHPLEATDSICLKINYNSTRRALWWCKLGCQKNSGPFIVPMSSFNMDGGKIGCIKCFILRVYPLKYLEKSGDEKVWRNRKAEERREQEFHSEKLFQNNIKDLQRINNPEILYNIMQTSHDPEGLQETLSSSQKTLLYDYTIKKEKHNSRSVTPALKMKIIDAQCESDKIYDFQIWRPGEEYLQELKEGEIVTIFNVSCSSKWGLSASKTTQFRRETLPKLNHERFRRFARRVTEIRDLRLFPKQKHWLNEFDTVGFVINKLVGDSQQVWMADTHQNLLIIKIYDSAKNILALDAINEGQIVSACNLVLKHAYETHCYAIGDHSVIFARYSQYRHLQDGLGKLEDDFESIDRITFVQECQSKIRHIEAQWGPKHMQQADLDGMECSQITITDMALLECVEKFT